MFESIHQTLVAADDRCKVCQKYNSHQARHEVFVQVFPCLVAHEEQLGFGVVDDVVDVVGLEFVQNRYDDSPISDGSQERDSPMGTVAAADGNLVAGLDAHTFQYNVKLGYFSGHVLVLQGCSFIVCQGITVPIVGDALLDISDEAVILFHVLFFLSILHIC